ncbi:helix-turn-helix transcriptional regulator [Sulfurospirillum arsenophilum]|uniref:helix-turn-helix transcriptional regulator n=1 Tax=Sulfurospirillum arsenophilum TaxID=56698 RepID=UPI0005A78D27|nr:helix-turn-helix transcriptional regulator [Sulfurospirillum arsenophilum]
MFLDTGMPPQGDYAKAFPKNPALLSYIHSYVSIISEVEDTKEQYITRFFPSFMTQFVFDFYGSLNEVVEEGSYQLDIDKGTYVKSGIGTWMDFFQKESLSRKRLVKSFKVTLYPHVLYEVFGISPFEIKDEELSINDIWGEQEGALLFEELESMNTAEGMIVIFERYFIKQLSKRHFSPKNISSYLVSGHAYPTLKILSKECGYSERWIQKQYLEVFGESFKHIQNNTRFIKTLRFMNSAVLRGESHLKFVSIAYECGYFDQTHFIKEFKKFTGLTPSYYFHSFREKIPLSWLW